MLLDKSFRAVFGCAFLLVATVWPIRAQTVKVLYRFGASGVNGLQPGAPLLLENGKLYGTTVYGGSSNSSAAGTVFEVDVHSRQETVLHAFTGPDGALPYSGLISDSVGNLYGTTSGGGPSRAGTVFKIDAAGTLITLHAFSGPDGYNPRAGLTMDSAGNLYGTTATGGPGFGQGSDGCDQGGGCGTVFKLAPEGTFSTLYSFPAGKRGDNPGSHGAFPYSSLLLLNGDLYGTAVGGGNHGNGVIFRIDPQTGKQVVLYHFTGGADGGHPYASLITDGAGNLYGTTYYGGPGVASDTASRRRKFKGYGVVFSLNITTAQETVLYRFTGGGDGRNPVAGLVRDSAGNLYGTDPAGKAPATRGALFEINASGSFSVLSVFGHGDGSTPAAAPILGPTGKLYGTTVSTVFEIIP